MHCWGPVEHIFASLCTVFETLRNDTAISRVYNIGIHNCRCRCDRVQAPVASCGAPPTKTEQHALVNLDFNLTSHFQGTCHSFAQPLVQLAHSQLASLAPQHPPTAPPLTEPTLPACAQADSLTTEDIVVLRIALRCASDIRHRNILNDNTICWIASRTAIKIVLLDIDAVD